MSVNFTKSLLINEEPYAYCPGCSHGIVHRLLAETVDELAIKERCVGVSSIGCSVRCWKFIDLDFVQGAHGRGLAVATGIKRAQPDKIVFTYQGDGDLIAIGMGETVHAAARGENVTVIFVNNTVFGATGGQLAPTTLIGQKTVTYPEGRDEQVIGKPIRMAELLATLDTTKYVARVSLDSPANIRQAKNAMKKSFRMQLENKGFSFVEFLAACPSNLKLTPVDAMKWIKDKMIAYYPLGEFKKLEGI
ncbi:MAG: 2-oxoglutarate oxidoreductase [Acidaminococcales bacterium]|jgi:2-oxoglutarate ferredoxin oxidoreductase subunit beta|nr:2-oxoglutarate oxidoreductase [Acidaminococcales bacterium]